MNLLQANIGGNTISRISPKGEVTSFASDGFENPVGIVIDRDDTVFVANCGGGSVQRIDRHGESSLFVESPLLACPNGITIDEEGNLYVSKKEYDVAEEFLQKALSVQKMKLGDEHPRVAITISHLGWARHSAEDQRAAAKYLLDARAMLRKAGVTEHPNFASGGSLLVQVAVAMVAKQDYAAAEAVCHEMLAAVLRVNRPRGVTSVGGRRSHPPPPPRGTRHGFPPSPSPSGLFSRF